MIIIVDMTQQEKIKLLKFILYEEIYENNKNLHIQIQWDHLSTYE